MTIKEFKNGIMGSFSAAKVEVVYFDVKEMTLKTLKEYYEDNDICIWASTLFRNDDTFDELELINVDCVLNDGKIKMIISIYMED